jgi:hypothetical protein
MSFAAIADALDAKFATFPAGGADIAWEGRAYNPIDGKPYFSTRMSAYTRNPLGYGADAYHEERGSYQITVFRPLTEGRPTAARIAAAVVAFYQRGSGLATSDGITVFIENASAQPAYAFGAWISIPVTVQWIAGDPTR